MGFIPKKLNLGYAKPAPAPAYWGPDLSRLPTGFFSNKHGTSPTAAGFANRLAGITNNYSTALGNLNKNPNAYGSAYVRQLQEKLGITVDGIYGPQTAAALARVNGSQRFQAQAQVNSANDSYARASLLAAQQKQKRDEFNAKMVSQANAIRKQLLQRAESYAKSKDAAARKAATVLREYALDPHKHDNYDVIHFAYGSRTDSNYSRRGLFGQDAQAEAKAANSAASGYDLNPFHHDFSLGKFVGEGIVPAANKLLSPVTNALDAATYAGLHTHGNILGSLGTSANAFVAGLPGAGALAPAGSSARKAVEATNTDAERAALMKGGRLATVGQLATGRYTKAFKANYGPAPFQVPNIPLGLRPPTLHKGQGLGDFLQSGLGNANPLGNDRQRASRSLGSLNPATVADIAVNTFTDPTLAASELIRPLALVGERQAEQAAKIAAERGGDAAAQQSARQSALRVFAQTDKRGISVIDTALDVVKNSQAPQDVVKALPGIDLGVADAAVQAVQNGSESAARKVLEDAFATRAWAPKVSLANQAGIEMGLDKFGLARPQQGLAGGKIAAYTKDTLSRWASAGKAGVSRAGAAVIHTGVAADAIPRALEKGLTAGKASIDAVDAAVHEANVGISTFERIGHILDYGQQSGNDAFGAAVDSTFRPLFSGKAVPDAAELEGRLQAAERLQAVLGGAAGPDAAEAARNHLATGYTPKALETSADVVQRAGDNLGLKLPGKPAEKGIDPEYLRENLIEGLPDGELKDQLTKDLDAALAEKGTEQKAGLGKVQSSVEALYNHPDLMEEAIRVGDQEAGRLSDAAISGLRDEGSVGAIRRNIGKLGSSFFEQVPKASVGITGSNKYLVTQEVTDTIDRVFAGLRDFGADAEFRGEVKSRIAELFRGEAQPTLQDVQKVYLDALGTLQDRAGLENDVLKSLSKARFNEGPTVAHSVDEAGKPIERPQLPTQADTTLRVLNPDELRKAINKELAAGGDTWSKLRVTVSKPGQVQIFGLSKGGKPLTVARTLAGGHRFWKFLIVSNAYMPVIGALAGALSGGSIADRARRAGIGFGIGLLGPVRYVGRTQLQDRFAAYEDNGILNKFFSRAHARSQIETGIIERPFNAVNFLDPAASGARQTMTGDLITTLGPDWVVLRPGQTRFIDGWWRVVNFQVHPESDPVMEALLRQKAGLLTEEEANAAIESFLNSDGGTLWKRQFAQMGSKGGKDAFVEQERAVVDKFIPEDIARKRIDVFENNAGEVSRDDLKAAKKAGTAPEYIHAQKAWIIPKGIGDVLPKINEVTGRLTHEIPHVQGSARPLANALYEENYYRALRYGADPEEAARSAEFLATNRANSVMFRADNFSRFSKKADFVSPFQGHREFTIKVWGRLMLENPGRTIRLVENGARAFNAGKDKGIFRKDAYGGWVLSVPGSAPLSRALFGVNTNFEANLSGFLIVTEGAFTSEGWSGAGLMPSPSSPYIGAAVKFLATTKPEWFDPNSSDAMPEGLRKVLFPYGLKNSLIRNEPNRLWMGMTGSTPPWEFLDRNDQEKELRNWQIEMFRQLRYQHYQETGDASWSPSPEEVKNATKHFFVAWSLIGSVFPASTHPVMPGQDDYQHAATVFEKVTGMTPFEDRAAFVNLYPAFDTYLDSKSKYVGPDDAKHWSSTHDAALETNLGERKELSLNEFIGVFKDGQRRSIAYREYGDALSAPTSILKEQALYNWRQKYPDLAKESRNSYYREHDLAGILASTPKGAAQDAAIERWRKQYGVSHMKYAQLRGEITHGQFYDTAWKAARYVEDVQKDVAKHSGSTDPWSDATKRYVATLNPAEQVSFWQWAKNHMNYSTGSEDPAEVYRKYEQLANNISGVYTNNAWLSTPKKQNPWQKLTGAALQNVRTQVQAAYDEIDAISPQMNALAASKSWKQYYALKDKRQSLYDHITALNNSIYNTIPDMGPYYEDLQALQDFAGVGNTDAAKLYFTKLAADQQNLQYLPSNEEAHYLSLPDPIKQAYAESLQKSLNIPDGQKGKKFWSYLTNFQQDLLEANMPAQQVADWQAQNPNTDTKGGKRGGKFFYHHKGTFNRLVGQYGEQGAGELSFALAELKAYNRRGGMAAPPAYAQYRALPNNPAVKNDFLNKHPEVANYIKLGPLASMPPLYAQMVSNIMVKYGKWSGNVQDVSEVTDLAFAREQLQRWSRRPDGARAPANYDLWVNMPTGPGKAAFLEAHPDVKNWIALGPMANMPEEYQGVVRDIMERYGEWTANQDPLGQTLSQYYATPGWAREQYLKDHPEVTAYWAATRTPAQQAIQDLTDQYFSLADPSAKRVFLASHPELQQHLLDSRNRRYNTFLNQVAQYMGANPALFEQYLSRQNDILAELLKRFASAPLVREVAPGGGLVAPSTSTASTESGRVRTA